jgi:hypothetical protein
MSEAKIQQEIVKAVRKLGILIFSVPNEGARGNAVTQGILIATGLWPGVSDLIAVLPIGVIFIEVKTDTGKQSPKQIQFQNRVESMGYQYHVVRSVQDTLAILSHP